MPGKAKVLLAWSSGKDSALALHELQQAGEYEVTGLLTTITADYGRVSMHGVRRELVVAQAAAVGLPLEEVSFGKDASIEDYEAAMRAALTKHKAAGVSAVAFGDLYLADVRDYRRDRLAEVDMQAVFPLWKRDTGELARRFIELGFQAVITCVDTQVLDGRFAGRLYDEELLADLPAGVDPCGENGEFHTFCFAGPIFAQPVTHALGEIVLRDERFNFCDVFTGG